ncbi:BTAD domain-containing putative transcriptional regulator [Mycobacterium sp. ITM-2016-00316]|uniref:BTAD domain-containing putative transcriptional regulator n=1 Tax=Mycobacterium sp. ITM-2016-00316 TaxID=2099695 RepID=UPI001304B086|nr:BTAD domain-containing putative transcriptional regulator [Mycobacterium sp. ITM-2016-00316]WNG83069.1 BTAD domain-containing putative transcriptional regulator [Mycobacterium sp. ITM-2016-00316]
MLEYRLFGPVAALWHGEPLDLGGLRQRAVLTGLLVDADRVVDVDTIVYRVWDDAPPPKPLSSLRSYVANLRRVLAVDDNPRLTTAGRGYRLVLGEDRLDSAEFEQLVEAGRRLAKDGRPDAAEATMAQAVTLWGGQPLADVAGFSYAGVEVHRLQGVRADADDIRYASALLRGGAAELVDGLTAAVASNPLRESLWGHLMVALHRCGRRAEALRHYDRIRDLLEQELRVAPSAALRRIAQQIRDDVPGAQARTQAEANPATQAQAPVGRRRELDGLQRAVADTAVRGHGGMTVLIGESGIGKTTLASAAVDLAARLGMTTAWAGHNTEIATPVLWTWTRVLRSLDGLTADTTTLGDDQAVIDTAEAVLATVIAPTVIVLDDLHRADSMTCAVLDVIATALPRHPLHVVITWQHPGPDGPWEVEEFQRLFARTDVTTWHIRGLDADAAGDLVRRLTGTIPTVRFITALLERTGGNPFYIQELVRFLHDEDALDATTDDIPHDRVPAAVLGLVRRRTAALPADTRSALASAAMIGIAFSTERLGAVSEIGGVAAALESAVDAGMLVAQDHRPGWYRFAHGIVRDAVSAQTAGTDKARRHARIAVSYAAGAQTPDELTEAADHAWRAGDQLEATVALDVIEAAMLGNSGPGAYRDSLLLATRGLEVCTRLPVGDDRAARESTLWLHRAAAHAVLDGQTSDAVNEALRRAFDIGHRTGDFTASVALQALARAGAGRYRESAALADGLVAAYRSTGDAVAGSAGHYLRALAAFMAGDLDACLAETSMLCEQLPPPDWRRVGALLAFDVRGHALAAWAHGLDGDESAAMASIDAGRALGRERNDTFGTAIVATSELQLAPMTGVVDDVGARAAELAAELDASGLQQLGASAHIIGRWARALDGDEADTVADMRAALAVHCQDGTRIFRPLYLALISDAERLQRNPATAHKTLQSARVAAKATGEHVWTPLLDRRAAMHA